MPYQKGHESYYKGKFREQSSNWKGGLWFNKNYRNMKLREWRHKKGISKKYLPEYLAQITIGESELKEHKKICQKRWKQSPAGKLSEKRHNLIHRTRTRDLTVEIIQQVYEDNIKKCGTLTCYLCEKPILFGEDHLEHKTPLSRGGTNERDNLDVSCEFCNRSKHDKTEEEYRTYKMEVLKK